jgi:hypothetical protein
MPAFDFETLRKALETRDVELLLGLYDGSAEARVVNKNTPPSRPFETSGWQELETYIRDFCDRDLVHMVADEVVGDDRVSYTETCTYPEGTAVFTANILELRNGLITRHTVLETWDE